MILHLDVLKRGTAECHLQEQWSNQSSGDRHEHDHRVNFGLITAKLRPIWATTIPTSPRGTIPKPIFKTFCQPIAAAPRPQPINLVTIAATRITRASISVDLERNSERSK